MEIRTTSILLDIKDNCAKNFNAATSCANLKMDNDKLYKS